MHGTGTRPHAQTDGSSQSAAQTSSTSNAILQPLASVGDLVSAILTLSLGGVSASHVAQLVDAIVSLSTQAAAPLTGSIVSRVLTPLVGTQTCLGQTDQAGCRALCQLVSSQCDVCAGDAACLSTIESVCGESAACR